MPHFCVARQEACQLDDRRSELCLAATRGAIFKQTRRAHLSRPTVLEKSFCRFLQNGRAPNAELVDERPGQVTPREASSFQKTLGHGQSCVGTTTPMARPTCQPNGFERPRWPKPQRGRSRQQRLWPFGRKPGRPGCRGAHVVSPLRRRGGPTFQVLRPPTRGPLPDGSGRRVLPLGFGAPVRHGGEAP